MRCPKCGSDQTRTIDSRPTVDDRQTRRRRVCQACRFRFSTIETAVTEPELMIEAAGLAEPMRTVETAARHLADALSGLQLTESDS